MADSEEFQADLPPQKKKPAADNPVDQEGYAVSPVPRPLRPKKRIRRDYEEDWEEEADDWRRSDGGISTLIPYTNPKALIAYYLGIFGLIPCLWPVLGPAAFILGILGLRYLKRRPGAHGIAHAIVGIVLGSLETIAAILVFALWAVPFISKLKFVT
jgi:hypothetical protein